MYGCRSAVCCHHLQLKMEAADCSEISVYISLHSFTSQNTALFTLTALTTDKKLICDPDISNNLEVYILYPKKEALSPKVFIR